MRKSGMLVGLILVGLAAPARAQDAAAPVVSTAAPASRRIAVAFSVLPMGLGRFKGATGGMPFTADAAFSYGFGVAASYVVRRGLSVGFAPQALFNVKPKEQSGNDAQEFDLMARVAYSLRLVDTIALYAELLPGYSLIRPSSGDTSKGPVLGFGGGATIDLTERLYTSLGVGYQVGFQKVDSTDVNTRYLRVALVLGRRF